MRAIGLMSGTSMDGVDAAIVETDGERILAVGNFLSRPYTPEERQSIASALGRGQRDASVQEAERVVTNSHIEAVEELLAASGTRAADIDIVGFHGQTIAHDPGRGFTWQIGDAKALANAIGIRVAFDFRSADVAAGGQGAPLAPVFHRAIAQDWEKPVVVLNLGGVANVTWIGPDGDMLAFDTGPANALIDDWMKARTGAAMDKNGAAALAGAVDRAALERLLDNPYFSRKPPKSLDRGDFEITGLDHLSTEDGAATLAAFTVESVALAPCPLAPKQMLVAGGGSRNPAIMNGLADRLPWPVADIGSVGWPADAIEAQAFAFIAVRCALGLPITFPGTTGVGTAMTGGRIVEPV